jgi:hypothetical protein
LEINWSAIVDIKICDGFTFGVEIGEVGEGCQMRDILIAVEKIEIVCVFLELTIEIPFKAEPVSI